MIEAKLPRQKRAFGVAELGGSGENLVALALAAARASITSCHAPTLLVLDDILASFDPYHKEFVLEQLGGFGGFQSVATLPGVDRHLPWRGWSLVVIKPAGDGEEGAEIQDG